METISTEATPSSIGPFSQAIRDGNRIYVSGQGPIDPATGDIVGETIEAQTAQTLENIATILEAADRSLANVVKATVFVREMDDYDAVNDVYADYMSPPYPARSAVEVAELPIDIDVEIEVVATDQ
jgi:reactive intermediate/imine deaminase